MEELMKYLVEDALIMIPVLNFIGLLVKNTDPIKDKHIPHVLALVSIGFTPWLLGGYTPHNIVQAILVAGGAVLLNQVQKQAKKED